MCRLKNPRSLKVRAGEWDTQTKNELYPHQDRNVKTIVIHPDYYAGALYNDIGLLFLENPVEYAENVDVVCLPPQGAVSDNSLCFATGWGKDTYGKLNAHILFAFSNHHKTLSTTHVISYNNNSRNTIPS